MNCYRFDTVGIGCNVFSLFNTAINKSKQARSSKRNCLENSNSIK